MASPHPSSAAIIDLYRRHAGHWIEQRGGVFFEQPWLDRFLAITGKAPHVLDIGCGSGKPMADYLIRQGAIITGVDASGPLLTHVRHRHGGPHIWLEADMRGLDLKRSFDGALAWHSAFHLTPDDQRAMFTVYQRHIRPGGALMFTGGPREGEALGQWQGEPLYHASLDPREYDALIEAHGFVIAQKKLEDPDAGGASIWLARRRD